MSARHAVVVTGVRSAVKFLIVVFARALTRQKCAAVTTRRADAKSAVENIVRGWATHPGTTASH